MNKPARLEVEEDDVICKCLQVKESTIRACIEKDNLDTIEAVTAACEAGGGCHSCHILIQLFIDQHQHKDPSQMDLVNQYGDKVTKKGILSNFLSRFKKTKA